MHAQLVLTTTPNADLGGAELWSQVLRGIKEGTPRVVGTCVTVLFLVFLDAASVGCTRKYVPTKEAAGPVDCEEILTVKSVAVQEGTQELLKQSATSLEGTLGNAQRSPPRTHTHT